jgi:hypothetical protein
MSADEKAALLGGLCGGLGVGLVITLVVIILSMGWTPNTDASRAAQQCDAIGQELGCDRNTAWFDGDRCSCALDGGRRISYENTWEVGR